jgi:hypothetical protein
MAASTIREIICIFIIGGLTLTHAGICEIIEISACRAGGAVICIWAFTRVAAVVTGLAFII